MFNGLNKMAEENKISINKLINQILNYSKYYINDESQMLSEINKIRSKCFYMCKVLEQLFANLGFAKNIDVSDSELLKELRKSVKSKYEK